MRRASLRELTRQLLARGTAGAHGEELAQAAQALSQKLSRHLVPVIGPQGFHILLTRSLRITSREFRVFDGVQAEPDGTVKGLREPVEVRDRAEATGALEALLANFLSLLVTFLGEDLGLRLVHEVLAEGSAIRAVRKPRRNEAKNDA